ncbi:hypothetical protein [Caldovatus aquaticus]|uniref:Lipoprotein n=1 Tax=Caldovatus aquaticus TaxID=2865671 RepID=A0ABS7F1E1_9PROT|nr:hypothetical protein [Caldovatus aquaticus]MBW8269424.1 hypothetical protein [Caldovatus aquaticus]
MTRPRAVPLLLALALAAAALAACERGGGQSGPYIGLGGGMSHGVR